MKKYLLTIIAFMLLSTLSAQNVARECVLFEVFTGVNCPYCPAAANGIEQMLEEGLAIAPVEYHTDAFSVEEFYTPETNARAKYYGISGYPTLKADGILNSVGGGPASQSMYSYYNNLYNQRINVTSPFTIDLSYSYLEGSLCQATAVVNQVGECNSTDVRVFIVLTESHIQYNWQGMSELNCVVRDIIPNQNGTVFNGGNQTVTGSFDMNGFDKENCNLVAWVQSYNGNREVYQAVRISLKPENAQYDIVLKNIEEVPLQMCSGQVSPRITVKSCGSEQVNTVLFNVKDENDDIINTYQWEGLINQGEVIDFVIPEFNLNGSFSFTVEAAEINGNADEYPFDNSKSVTFDAALLCDGYLKLQLKTGSPVGDLTADIVNMDNGEVIESMAFDQPSHTYVKEFYLTSGCFRMTFRNSEGTGIGKSFFILKDSENNTIAQASPNTNKFRYELSFEFNSDGTSSIDDNVEKHIDIYPNPASSMINIDGQGINKVKIYNSIGQLVFAQEAVINDLKIDVNSWGNGLYFINVETVTGKKTSQKIVVNK